MKLGQCITLLVILQSVVLIILLDTRMAVRQTALALTLQRAVKGGSPKIFLVPYASGFSFPVDIASAGDGRLFVVEQTGTIRIIAEGGVMLPESFLEIPPDELTFGIEEGLLGLVFHPDYITNGYLYVNYIDENGDTHISRFSRSMGNPNRANYESEVIILTVDQPHAFHKAGDLAFGPDGYLYVPLGDGAIWTGEGPQDPTHMLGKMLRIDVSVDQTSGLPSDCGASPHYKVPPDNPLIDGPAGNCDEIWALGLRNPWRFSFDRATGDMYIADVGATLFEEVNFQSASSLGGENYGWACYEGSYPLQTKKCDTAYEYTFPIFEYPHSQASSKAVTGGFVYRGSRYPGLHGYYHVADFISGDFWLLRHEGNVWESFFMSQLMPGDAPSSFGEDANGELYVAGYSTGTIYQVHRQLYYTFTPLLTDG